MKKIKNYFKNKLNELKFKNIRKIIKKNRKIIKK